LSKELSTLPTCTWCLLFFYKTLESVNRSKKSQTVKRYGNPARGLIILSYDGFTYQVVNEGLLPGLKKLFREWDKDASCHQQYF